MSAHNKGGQLVNFKLTKIDESLLINIKRLNRKRQIAQCILLEFDNNKSHQNPSSDDLLMLKDLVKKNIDCIGFQQFYC